MSAGRLDWPGLLRAGLGELRLLPRDFWALTPGELRLMLGRTAGPAPFTRARLEELAAAYPDPVKEAVHDRIAGHPGPDHRAGSQP